MTFIIARKSGNSVIVIADTKLSPEPQQFWSLTSQANKIVCLDQNWVFTYSGNFHFAEAAFLSAQAAVPKTFASLRQSFVLINQESIECRSSVDFLLINTVTLAIYKIYDGKCERQLGSAAWIGSKAAFEKYQELHHLPSDQSHPLLKSSSLGGSDGYDIAPQVIDEKRKDVERRMDRILKALIEDGDSPEVGGFAICAVVHEGVCRFWPRAGRILAVPPGGLEAFKLRDFVFGDAASGDFQYDVISGWNAADNTVAVFFRAVEKALVFRCWNGGLPQARLIGGISASDPGLALGKLYGIQMWQVRVTKQGNVISVDASPPV